CFYACSLSALFSALRPPPTSTLFPYTTLFRSGRSFPQDPGYCRVSYASVSAVQLGEPSKRISQVAHEPAWRHPLPIRAAEEVSGALEHFQEAIVVGAVG